MESFEYSGDWWFPENPQTKYKGKLAFNNKTGGLLDIQGFDEQLMMLSIHREKFFLHGRTEDDVEISLWVNYIAKYNEQNDFKSNTSVIYCTFAIMYIFIGKHLEGKNIDDLRLTSLSVKFLDLDKWIYYNDLNEVARSSEYKSDEVQVNIEGKEPIIIQFVGNLKFNKIERKIVREFDIAVNIKSSGESLDQMMFIKNHIRDFLNLVIAGEVNMTSLKAKFVNTEDNDIEIFYASTIDDEMKKVIIKTPYIFGYAEIKQRFQLILNKWFKLYKESPTLLNLYFGVMYNPKSYLSNTFLMLYQAIEVYHRTYLFNSSQFAAERSELIEDFIKIVNESITLEVNQKDRIIGLIQNGKNLRSREKISEIYDLFSDILPKLSTKIKNKDDFINKIEKYRNKLTHGGVDYDKLNIEELFWSVKDLQLILQLCILNRLGFTNKEISKFYYLDKLS